jgi:hypothetical protein
MSNKPITAYCPVFGDLFSKNRCRDRSRKFVFGCRKQPNYRFTLESVRLGDHDYIHNTWFFDAAAPVQDEPEKEWAHTVRLLNRHGYTVPEAMCMSRYVRILDATRKSELILFYMEPLAPTGFTLADFVEGGAGAKVFDRLSAEITARSENVFMVEHG